MLFGIFRNGRSLRSLQRDAAYIDMVDADYAVRLAALKTKHDETVSRMNEKFLDATDTAVADRYAAINQLREEITAISELI